MKLKVFIQVLITFLTISYLGVVFSTTVNLQTDATMEMERRRTKHKHNHRDYEYGLAKLERPKNYNKVFMQKSENDLTNYHGKFPKHAVLKNNANLDMKLKSTYTKNSKCHEKTGLLYLLRNEKVKDETDPTKLNKVITIKPQYVILNEKSLSVMDDQSPLSLVKSIPIDKIARCTQQYTHSHCFDIVEEKRGAPLTLCSDTKAEMDGWIVSILEFKECLLKEKFELIDANSNAFIREHKQMQQVQNSIRKGHGVVPHPLIDTPPVVSKQASANDPSAIVETVTRINQIPEALYYKNTYTPSPEIMEITETDEALTKILNDKKREEIAQRQIKRQIDDKLRRVKEAHKKIVKEQKKLMKKNLIQKEKEIAIATMKIESLAKKEEKKVLIHALHSMQQMNVIILIILLNF